MDLVVGVEKLPASGETVSSDHFHMAPGGKGANQAVAAARLGASVKMVGRVGLDSYGDELLSSLASSGVDTTYVYRDNTPTGVALITVETGGMNTIVVCPNSNGECTPEDVEKAENAIAAADALITQLEIPLKTVEWALRIGRKHSVLTVLNPAPARTLPDTLLREVDLLVPNESEAEAILGYPVDSIDTAIAAAASLQQLGPKMVIVTLGAKGAIFAGAEGCFAVPPFEVEACDSTGAGDAFIGAFVAAYGQGMDTRASLRFASAAGALAATRPGAQPSFPMADEVLEMIDTHQEPA